MRRSTLGLLLLALTGIVPARATTYVAVSDEHLVDRAAVIGTFHVLATDLAPTPTLQTEYQLRVDTLLKGDLEGSIVLVRVPGGETRSGEGLRFYGMPSFRPGESVLLFLVPRRDGSWGIAHTILGAFRTLPHADGALLVRPHLEEAVGLDRRGGSAGDEANARSRARFLGWIADRVAGVTRTPDYVTSIDVRALTQRFTLFRDADDGFPLRWFAFDGGSSVLWQADQAGAPTFADGGAAAVQAGLAAWTAVTQTNISLVWGGMGPLDLLFDQPDGRNVVTWEDPNLDIDEPFDCTEGGVLAIGGPWYSSQVLRYRNQNWHPIVEGQVIMNRNLSCYWQGNTVRLSEVVGHELGHTLGIGHSCGGSTGISCAGNPAADDALMRATAHNDNRGPRLAPDDIAAARGSYGTAGGTLRAPTKLTATVQVDDVQLSWTDRSQNEQGFRVYRRLGGGAFTVIGQTGAGQSAFSDVDLAAGTYSYEVRAFNAGGESSPSNRVTVTVAVVIPGAAQLADSAFYGSEESGDAVITLRRVGGKSGALQARLRTQDLSATSPADYGARDVVITWADGDDADKLVNLVIVDDFTSEDAELVEVLLENVPAAGVTPTTLGTAAVAIADDDGAPGCAPSDRRLCLLGGRFKVEVEWRNQRNGARGLGHAISGSEQSGYFWFFDAQNVELITKMLDGRPITGAHWLFYGALSDVEYWVVVTDTATGERKLYRNPPGEICGVGDTGAFPQAAPASADATAAATSSFAEGTVRAMGGLGSYPPSSSWFTPGAVETASLTPRADCVATAQALCLLDGRFRVEVSWRNHRNGATGVGTAVTFSDQTGFFWFFDPANIELVAKSLDGRGVNGEFWFFYGALSDVEYTIRVTDMVTLAEHFYNNAGGNICGVGDIEAFPGD